MADHAAVDTAHVIRDIIVARAGAGRSAADINDETPIGSSGLGLDSVAIVELLLECEEALAIPFPGAIFDGGPLTMRRLIDHAAGYSRGSRE